MIIDALNEVKKMAALAAKDLRSRSPKMDGTAIIAEEIFVPEWSGEKDYSKVFGDSLVKLAKDNKKIIAITAAMKDGTGLTDFAKKYPDRFFDVGIAEQHAVGMAAGMAKVGMIPVVPLYSSFIQRAYDQLIHDVAIQNLPVIICADRAGIVGNDGETHQGLLDLAFTNNIPNFTIMAPKDFNELENMMKFSVDLKKPVLVRYPRGGEDITFDSCDKIEFGKAEVIEKGNDITIVAIGKMVARAKEVSDILKEDIQVGKSWYQWCPN